MYGYPNHVASLVKRNLSAYVVKPRLWTLWQQEDPETHLNDYAGFCERLMTPGNSTSGGNSTDGGMPNPCAAITDTMPFMGLAGVEDLPVSSVMDTTSELLCYKY